MGIKSKRVNADRSVNNLGSRYIKNEDWASLSSGTYMTVGQIVSITGASGSYATASKAQADVALDTSQLWIAKQDIWEFGEVARWAHLTDQVTTGSSIGDPVYLSDTAGGWTLTIPSIPVVIGKVLVVSATIGEISIDLTTVSSAGGASNFGATGIATDVIAESTAAAGVTVDGVLIKDGGIVMADGAAIDADTVNEATAAAGVTLDGVLLKDGGIIGADGATLEMDIVNEATAAAGVTIDGLLLKDSSLRPNVIADPGDLGAIPVDKSGTVAITTAAAETNTMAIPTFQGQRMTLFIDTYAVGSRVITVASAINVANNTIMTFPAASTTITLEGITTGGTLSWMVVANDGVTFT